MSNERIDFAAGYNFGQRVCGGCGQEFGIDPYQKAALNIALDTLTDAHKKIEELERRTACLIEDNNQLRAAFIVDNDLLVDDGKEREALQAELDLSNRALKMQTDALGETGKERDRLAAENAALARALDEAANDLARIETADWEASQMRLGAKSGRFRANQALSQLGARTKAVMGILKVSSELKDLPLGDDWRVPVEFRAAMYRHSLAVIQLQSIDGEEAK